MYFPLGSKGLNVFVEIQGMGCMDLFLFTTPKTFGPVSRRCCPT